jgi:hypothetical protein
MATVRFSKFLNSGTGVMGRSLAPVSAVGFWLTPVELQFSIEPATYDRYKNLRPVNWSGTDAIWFKSGNPLTAHWQKFSSSNGIGADGPDPGNSSIGRDLIAYYDNPGLPLAKIHAIRPNASWVWLVQNFTGWVEGEPIAGGAAERLCEVAAWWSIVSMANANWQDPKQPEAWDFTSGTGSGTGWADTSKAAPI